MAAAVIGLSPVIMMVLIPIRRSSAKRSLMPPLTMSLSSMMPRTTLPSATTSGVAPRLATVSTPALTSAGKVPPLAFTYASIDAAAPPRLRGERNEPRPERLHVALADPELLLREHDDAAALRRLVGERGQLR